ncbi:hypothetical protein ACFX2C_041172 [Malus domestica]
MADSDTVTITFPYDIIARFGKQEAMPREFFMDFVKVAQDEGHHFTLLASRLEEMGLFYGALATHDGLWPSGTRQLPLPDLMARLAIEHCVHEARGLNVVPTTISQFRNKGDDKTAELRESVEVGNSRKQDGTTNANVQANHGEKNAVILSNDLKETCHHGYFWQIS